MSAELLVGFGIGTVVTTVVVSRYAQNLLAEKLAELLTEVTCTFVAENGKEFDIKMRSDADNTE